MATFKLNNLWIALKWLIIEEGHVNSKKVNDPKLYPATYYYNVFLFLIKDGRRVINYFNRFFYFSFDIFIVFFCLNEVSLLMSHYILDKDFPHHSLLYIFILRLKLGILFV